MKAHRTQVILRPDCKRVLFRPFKFADERRVLKILARIMTLSEAQVQAELQQVIADFGGRHQHVQAFFLKRFADVRQHLPLDAALGDARKLLIGAYFTQEYSLESAALFNPSMVWHPDQSGAPEGRRRFILSLRATGEGHISSITFRTGLIDAECNISLDTPTRFVTAPEIVPDPQYDRALFERKLAELGLLNAFARRVLSGLDDAFALSDLEANSRFALRQSRLEHGDNEATARGILALAASNYEMNFSPDQHLSERIIFPHAPSELNGIEDARFVEFVDDDGHRRYYATYTAYDGRVILPQFLETDDFLQVKIRTLNGPEARGKGMALFPRKINGLYAMLSRQDNENIYLMFSEHVHFWHEKQLLLKPSSPWEFVQLGNCGAPIETEAGWLVLSHGVGAMRKYAIGAFLLDLHDPSKVIGRLCEPLLSPDENEREGYVPNVVYSCGAQIHAGKLVIPYAMSDTACSFAWVPLDELLAKLVQSS